MQGFGETPLARRSTHDPTSSSVSSKAASRAGSACLSASAAEEQAGAPEVSPFTPLGTERWQGEPVTAQAQKMRIVVTQPRATSASAAAAFNALDANNDGVISRSEFTRAFNQAEPPAEAKVSPTAGFQEQGASTLEQKVHTLLDERKELKTGSRSTWERESEVLDQKEREIHLTQMKMMREQMTTFSRYMASLRDNMDEMLSTRERDQMQLRALQEETTRDRQDFRDDVMASLARLQEEILGRVEASEAQHSGRVGELHSHTASMQERVSFLEQTIGDSADRHAEEIAALRAQHGNLADGFSQHAAQVEQLNAAHADHRESMTRHARSVEDAQGRHLTIEERLQELEAAMGEQGERHSGAFDDVSSRFGDLHGNHQALEQSVSDFMDKHTKKLYALKTSHEKHASSLDQHRASIEGPLAESRVLCEALSSRLEAMEGLHADTRDRHTKKLFALSSVNEKHWAHLSQCSTDLDSLNADTATRHSSFDEKLTLLQQMQDEARESHSDGLSQAHSKFDAMHQRLVGDLQRSHEELAGRNAQLATGHASVGERLDYLEKMLGDSADKHAEEVRTLQDALSQHATQMTDHREQHASLPERVSYIEQQLGNSADHHTAEVERLHEKLAAEQAIREQHHGTMSDWLAREQEERGGHHATFNERLDHLERLIGDTADKHAGEVQKILSGHETLAGELQTHGDRHGGVLERVAQLEVQLQKAVERHAREIRSHQARMSIIKDAWAQETPRE